MKGLLLASMDRREEGLELAKKGVRLDLTSFICWHALGILNRIDRNYPEAIKCYGQALRIDKVSLCIPEHDILLSLASARSGIAALAPAVAPNTGRKGVAMLCTTYSCTRNGWKLQAVTSGRLGCAAEKALSRARSPSGRCARTFLRRT